MIFVEDDGPFRDGWGAIPASVIVEIVRCLGERRALCVPQIDAFALQWPLSDVRGFIDWYAEQLTARHARLLQSDDEFDWGAAALRATEWRNSLFVRDRLRRDDYPSTVDSDQSPLVDEQDALAGAVMDLAALGPFTLNDALPLAIQVGMTTFRHSELVSLLQLLVDLGRLRVLTGEPSRWEIVA